MSSNSFYHHLPDGWREIAELLADIRDELREMNAAAALPGESGKP